jgi:hypothetical protein
MNKIEEIIIENRPNLSKSSIATYKSILKSIHKASFGDIDIDIKDFDKTKEILKALDEKPITTRKTILSALFVITDNDIYRKKMLEDITDYNKEIGKQEKTEKQKDNWIEKEDISKLFVKYLDNSKYLYKKKNLSMDDLQEIQLFIILCLLGGIYIPPRRSKDYVDFKIKDIDSNTDNFIKGSKLQFNSYKTSKTYGLQTVDVPKPLTVILKKWISINPTDYLLFDSKKQKLTNVKLNQRLNKIFSNNHVGVNSMRKTYLTDKFAVSSDIIKDIDKTFKDMGSSGAQFQTYVKTS